jgi:signal transduction histidine kinase
LPNATNRPLLRAKLETFPSGDRLLVGRDINDLDSFTDQIEVAVISGVALIFVLAGVASILVTRRTVGRIEAINTTSRAIMLSDLNKRIPLRGANDEWDRVAENLNLMLDRIGMLMDEIKQVSDNVAHDLRTPLTRMRGRLEKAYHGQRIGEDDQLSETLSPTSMLCCGYFHLSRGLGRSRRRHERGVPNRESGRNRQ